MKALLPKDKVLQVERKKTRRQHQLAMRAHDKLVAGASA